MFQRQNANNHVVAASDLTMEKRATRNSRRASVIALIIPLGNCKLHSGFRLPLQLNLDLFVRREFVSQ